MIPALLAALLRSLLPALIEHVRKNPEAALSLAMAIVDAISLSPDLLEPHIPEDQRATYKAQRAAFLDGLRGALAYLKAHPDLLDELMRLEPPR